MNPTSRRQSPLALAAAGVTVVLWASAFVGIRAAGQDLSPGPLALLRLVVGSLLLGAFVLARRDRMPPRRDLPGVVACGVLWFGIYNLALNAGERQVDAGTAAMILSLGPVLLALMAGIFLREGFPRSLVIGGATALAGAVVIGFATSADPRVTGAGAALCLLAALVYAGSVTIQKPLLARSSGLVITWLACTVGAIVCLPFAPALISELATASPASITWTIYLGALPTAVAFTTWAYALARTTAGRMGATLYLIPPLTILMGWLFLGEVPPTLALLGGALCLGGVMLARSGGSGKANTAEPVVSQPREEVA
ncbi:MAG: DMT family transporter [Thermoanaerobaculia bacterium]